MLASFLVIGLWQSSEPFPVGSYRADVSQAPARSRGVLQVVFSQTFLVVKADGSFTHCAFAEQSGYWRVSGDKVVLVRDGFFSLKSFESKENLLRRWPRNPVEGFVLERGKNKTLFLRNLGDIKGPVLFHPMPVRTIARLLIDSHSFADDAPAANEAWHVLMQRREAEWPSYLAFIKDPKYPIAHRRWAAILLRGLRDPDGILAIARLTASVKPTERSLARALAYAVAEYPSEESLAWLIVAHSRGLLSAANVAKAMISLPRARDIPLLMRWLNEKETYAKIYSLNALAEIGATDALPKARRLASEASDEAVQIAATSLIARCTNIDDERRAAIRKLAEWSRNSDFMLATSAVEALCRSRAKESLAYVIAVLQSDQDPIVRINAAIDLGQFGDARAIPALKDAKNRRSGRGSLVEESRVCHAAADAIEAILQRNQQDR